MKKKVKKSHLVFVPSVGFARYEDLNLCILGLDFGAYDWERVGGSFFLVIFNFMIGFRLDRIWD